MNNLPTESLSQFDPLIEKFANIKENYGENYPIVLYEPNINCQEKKALKDLLEGNDSIHLFSESKKAFEFVQSLGISFILIIPSDFDEQHVLKNFQASGNVHGRMMFDFEEEALFKDVFQGLSDKMIKSLKIKAFVFVTLLDFMVKAPVNKEEEEEVMIMRGLKDMAKEFRQDFVVLWYDPQKSPESKRNLEEKIELKIEESHIFLDPKELYQKITNYIGAPYHLIFSGRKEAEKIIKEIDNFKDLLGLYIYDDNSQEISDKKVEIKKRLEQLIPKIKEGFRTRSKLINTFPSFATNFDAVDKTEIYNMHYFLRGLIKFDNRKQAKEDFIKLARKIYQDQNQELLRFESEYDQFNGEKIIHWYTRDSPVYKLLNNCLRKASSDSILYSRFVLKELEEAIRGQYQQHWKNFNGVVYRGAYISVEEWEKLEKNLGEEIEMYGFLSTTVNKRIAIHFFETDPQNKIFITIIVPPLPEFDEQGFADISKFSEFKGEREILFNVRSRFRILEAQVSEIDDRGTKGRHLVLLYGARPLRKYMTNHKPVISMELKLPSEAKCGLCGSIKELFAFNQGMTEVRCLDCLIKNSVPNDTPLLALDFENKNKDVKVLKGQKLTFNQVANFSYSGYKCHNCQKKGKERYYKWIELKTEKHFVQCLDCFKNKKETGCQILLAESSPYALWQEYQQEWEKADVDYQAEVSISIVEKEKDQGDVYLDVQKFDLCIEYERKLAQKLSRKRWREVAKLKCFDRMGKANEGSANYQKALEIYLKVVDISEFRHNRRDLSASYDSLASVYRNLGQNQEALQCSAKALSIMKEIYGDYHQGTAISYNNIAAAHQNLGEHKKALEYFEKALEIRQASFGDKHPETAISYSNYGRACRESGKYQRALVYDQKALDINKEIFGEKHPATAHSYIGKAAAYHSLGRYHETLENQKKALDITRSIFGENHPETAISYNNCAVAFDHLREYGKSLEYHKMALDIRKAKLGKKHPETALSYDNYGAAFARLKKYQEALKYQKKALEIRKTIFKDKHPDIIQSYNNIAAVYQHLKKYEEALEYSTKALNLSKDLHAEKHSLTAYCYSNCSVIYSSLGRSQEALEFSKKALAIRKTLFGDQHPETADSYYITASAYSCLKQYQKGREYSKEAIHNYESLFGEMDPRTASASNSYAFCCEKLGEYKEAIWYFSKAYRISEALFGREDPTSFFIHEQL